MGAWVDPLLALSSHCPSSQLPPVLLPLPTHKSDDLWSLDLNKLDGWRCVKENTVGEEAFKDLSSDEWETGSDRE